MFTGSRGGAAVTAAATAGAVRLLHRPWWPRGDCHRSGRRRACRSTGTVWQPQNVGKAHSVPKNLIVSGAVHGQISGQLRSGLPNMRGGRVASPPALVFPRRLCLPAFTLEAVSKLAVPAETPRRCCETTAPASAAVQHTCACAHSQHARPAHVRVALRERVVAYAVSGLVCLFFTVQPRRCSDDRVPTRRPGAHLCRH